jgi:hypothetical protein
MSYPMCGMDIVIISRVRLGRVRNALSTPRTI